jgi:hypothetical protein
MSGICVRSPMLFANPIVALATDGTTLYANQVALEQTELTVCETGASCRLVRQ